MITEADDTAAYLIAKYLTDNQVALIVGIFAVAQRSEFAAHVCFTLADIARVGTTEAGADMIAVPNFGLPQELVDEACKFAQAAINLEEEAAMDILDNWLHARTEEEHGRLIVTLLHILVGVAANTAEVKACSRARVNAN